MSSALRNALNQALGGDVDSVDQQEVEAIKRLIDSLRVPLLDVAEGNDTQDTLAIMTALRILLPQLLKGLTAQKARQLIHAHNMGEDISLASTAASDTQSNGHTPAALGASDSPASQFAKLAQNNPNEAEAGLVLAQFLAQHGNMTDPVKAVMGYILEAMSGQGKEDWKVIPANNGSGWTLKNVHQLEQKVDHLNNQLRQAQVANANDPQVAALQQQLDEIRQLMEQQDLKNGPGWLRFTKNLFDEVENSGDVLDAGALHKKTSGTSMAGVMDELASALTQLQQKVNQGASGNGSNPRGNSGPRRTGPGRRTQP